MVCTSIISFSEIALENEFIPVWIRTKLIETIKIWKNIFL
jgi:hypothetical protein